MGERPADGGEERLTPGRLDDEQLTTLQQWAEGLARDPRDEVRAAAKAILILVEEVERLNVEVWNGPLAAGAEPESVAETLRARLLRLRRGG